MKIVSKLQFFEMWEAGLLGNRTHLFRDPEAAFRSAFPLIGFRQLTAGGGLWERVPREHVLVTAERWKARGVPFIMDSGIHPATDADITLQGEICRTVRGLEGFIGVTPGHHMRSAMKNGLLHSYSGAMVQVILPHYMDPSSQDDLEELLRSYPDATIEFTCFRCDVGVFPHRNTLFWEVRDY